MSESPPEAQFVRALAAGVLRAEEGEHAGAAAHAALRDFLAGRKSLVLDVQFTGFSRRGEAVGGVDPALLRAAAHLIILRVTRLGFTAEASGADLRALFGVLSRTPADLPAEGIVAVLRELSPRGVYLGTSTGEAYRPPAAEPAPEAAPPQAPEEEETALAEFELLDPARAAPRAAGEGEGKAKAKGPPPPPPPPAQEEPPSDDLYHFFRTASAAPPRREEEAEALEEALRAAESLNRFDELTHAAAAAVPRLLDTGMELRAVRLLDTLVGEAQRADRTRVFRDSAVQALRRIGTEHLLARLGELLPLGGEARERLLRTFVFVGGDALSVLEGTVLRTRDAELREAVFRALLGADPLAERLLERVMEDPSVPRARAVLELAHLPGVDPALTLRWTERAAAHPEATVRMDAVRSAEALGGRGGVRVLLDLLGDAERIVRRAAIASLAALGDAAAVPFLARVVGESGDEELQMAAVSALGKIGSPEALPALTAVLSRRQWIGGARLKRLKSAAVAALGRIPSPAARDVLQALADGRDAELAAEAKRALEAAGRDG